jgi:hypothetical protein
MAKMTNTNPHFSGPAQKSKPPKKKIIIKTKIID